MSHTELIRTLKHTNSKWRKDNFPTTINEGTRQGCPLSPPASSRARVCETAKQHNMKTSADKT
jgi:hypothetical protein